MHPNEIPDDMLAMLGLPIPGTPEHDAEMKILEAYDLRERKEYMPMIWALMAAGWQIQWGDVGPSDRLLSFNWRRPPRRPGKPGRKFFGTVNSHKHMLAEKANGHGSDKEGR